MAKSNEDARDEFLTLLKMANFEIESLRVADFLLDGVPTSAIGVIKDRDSERGYFFEPYFIHVNEGVHDLLDVEEGGTLLQLGFPEPPRKQ